MPRGSRSGFQPDRISYWPIKARRAGLSHSNAPRGMESGLSGKKARPTGAELIAMSLERVVQLPALAARPADSNKGNFGRVLVVAGSRGMAGAAVLAGSACLRAGAGLVRVASPQGILATV